MSSAPMILSGTPGSFARDVFHERHPKLVQPVLDALPHGLSERDLDGAADATRQALGLHPYLESGRARQRMTSLRDEFKQSDSPLAHDVTEQISAVLAA